MAPLSPIKHGFLELCFQYGAENIEYSLSVAVGRSMIEIITMLAEIRHVQWATEPLFNKTFNCL